MSKILLERVEDVIKTQRYNALAFLELYEEASKIVHPHHEIICQISKWLLPIFCRERGKTTQDFPIDRLNLKRKLALEQIKVTEAINPGVNKVRGKLEKCRRFLLEFPTHFAYFYPFFFQENFCSNISTQPSTSSWRITTRVESDPNSSLANSRN